MVSWILICKFSVLILKQMESCSESPFLHRYHKYTGYLFFEQFQHLSFTGLWFILSYFLCMVIDTGLISVFHIRTSRFLNTICWRCCCFCRVLFWHLWYRLSGIPLTLFFLLRIVLLSHLYFKKFLIYFCEEWDRNFNWDYIESVNGHFSQY